MPVQDKTNNYLQLLKGAENLVDEKLSDSTNLCLLLAYLKYELDLFWVGIYWLEGDRLYLGPFQGMVACTEIGLGKGVCGLAARSGEIQIVRNVNDFPGYIACHAEAKSEIVLPAKKNNSLKFVLDVDSDKYAAFDEVDAKYLDEYLKIMLRFV